MIKKCLKFCAEEKNEIGKYHKFILTDLLIYYAKKSCLAMQFSFA